MLMTETPVLVPFPWLPGATVNLRILGGDGRVQTHQHHQGTSRRVLRHQGLDTAHRLLFCPHLWSSCFSQRSRAWGNPVLRASDSERANQGVVAAAATTSPGTLGVLPRLSSCICGDLILRPSSVLKTWDLDGMGWGQTKDLGQRAIYILVKG